MCFEDEPQETDREEHDRLAAERAAIDAQNAAIAQQQATAARQARALADAQTAAERRAAAAALEAGDGEGSMDEEDPKKKKKAGRGISSLRINRTSSLGGAPIAGGSGLTVG